MNFFHLFAHGEAFDVDAFLASTSLEPAHVWRKGDRRRYCPPEVDSRHPTSGVEFVLGDGLSIPMPEQDRIAIDYLKAHRDGLRALGQFPGVAAFILMFHYEQEFDGDRTGCCVGPSKLLMWHALDVGVSVDYTVILNRRIAADECEDEAAAPGAAVDRAGSERFPGV